jgi:uncharacterized membrane protein YphA (DoxX/SURF4 family)
MTPFSKLARTIFAAAMACFGIQHLLYAFSLGPRPSPPWTPSSLFFIGLIGTLLLLVSVAVLLDRSTRHASVFLAALLLAHIAIFHVPTILTHPNDPNQWISAFELLSMSAGALLLSTAPPVQHSPSNSQISVLIPRLLLVMSLIDFGVAHFMYAKFVATLVPAWIPGHLFWAEFVGAAFIAAALAIATTIQIRLAGILLGAMFLIFVITTHLPRIAALPHNPDEWTSGFVALAMVGVSWITASTASPAQPRIRALRPERIEG